ncbi:hypothetical protein [Pseudomonas aeruginosa]|uniref:hypothetical protein n=1 Tax=Pseudomonas aeruginosa TaxID=287 RepID=UPI003D9C58A7
MLQEGPRHLAGAQHDDLAAEPLGQLLRALQAHPRLFAAQAAGIDMHHAQAGGGVRRPGRRGAPGVRPARRRRCPPAAARQRRALLAALAVAVGEVSASIRAAAVCIASSAQRGEIGLGEERVDRRLAPVPGT